MAELLPATDQHQWSHLLAELRTTDQLLQPIGTSSRIQYTCISVSEHYIALGASSGAIYLFSKNDLQYLLLIPGERERGVVQLAFGPDGNTLAYATSLGIVEIIKFNLAKKSIKLQRVHSISDHKGVMVTAMCWNELGDHVFIGDSCGKVTATKVVTVGLLQVLTDVIMRLDSFVVQLDIHGERVLASTLHRSYIANVSRHQFTQIGKRLRDGSYGACFFSVIAMEMPLIYCARPGSRLWEVNCEAIVLNTHQFKQLLDVPPLPVFTVSQPYPGTSNTIVEPQAVAFHQLNVLSECHLLAVGDQGLYILNPAKVKVISWTNIQGMQQVRCHGNDIYILCSNNRVRHLTYMSIDQLASYLLVMNHITICIQLIISLKHSFLALPEDILRQILLDLRWEFTQEKNNTDLVTKCARISESVWQETEELFDIFKIDEFKVVEQKAKEKKTEFVKLDSGLFASRTPERAISPLLKKPIGYMAQFDDCKLKTNIEESLIQESIYGTQKNVSPRITDPDSLESKTKDPATTPLDINIKLECKTELDIHTAVEHVQRSDLGETQHLEELLESHSTDMPDTFCSGMLAEADNKMFSPPVLWLAPQKTEASSIIDESQVPMKTQIKVKTVDLQDDTIKVINSRNISHTYLVHAAKNMDHFASSSPRETVLAMKNRMTSTAKSLVKSIRVQGSRLTAGQTLSNNLQDTEIPTSQTSKLRSEEGEKTSSSSANLGHVDEVSQGGTHRGPEDRTYPMFDVLNRLSVETQLKLKDCSDDGPSVTQLLNEWIQQFYRTLESLFNSHEETEGDYLLENEMQAQKTVQLEPAQQRTKESSSDEQNLHSPYDCVDCDIETMDILPLDHDNEIIDIPRLLPQANCDSVSDITSFWDDQSDVVSPLSGIIPDLLTFLPEMCGKEMDQIISVPHIISDSSPHCLTSSQVNSPYGIDIPHALKRIVEELLMMCFKNEIHGNIEVCDKSDIFAKLQSKLFDNSNIIKDTEGYKLTLRLAGFLRLCMRHMDKSDVIESIWQIENPCRRHILWRVAMEHLRGMAYQDPVMRLLLEGTSVQQLLDGFKTGSIRNPTMGLACLTIAFQKDPESILEFCGCLSSQVDPLHVLYMCKGVKVKSLSEANPVRGCEVTNVQATENHVHMLWLYYVQLYINTRTYLLSRVRLLHELCSDMELYWMTLEAILLCGPDKSKVKCQCGYPRPNSHQAKWPHSDLLTMLLMWPDLGIDQSQKLSHLLDESGYWIGYLSNMKFEPRRTELQSLELILQLNDMELFQKHINYGYCPQNAADWILCLELRVKQRDAVHDGRSGFIKCLKCGNTLKPYDCGNCTHLHNGVQCNESQKYSQYDSSQSEPRVLLHDENSNESIISFQSQELMSETFECYTQFTDVRKCITWERLIEVMLEGIGADDVAVALKGASFPEGAIPFSSLKLIFSYKLAQAHKGTSLPQYRQHVLPAAVVKAAQMEGRDLSLSGKLSQETKKMFASLSLSKQAAASSTNQHWGMLVNIDSTCPVCGLKLAPSQTPVDCGINVLACGHTIHAYCYHQITRCPVCKV